MNETKILLELTVTEAQVLARIIQNHTPIPENEMIAIMLYARITRKIEEKMNG